MSKTKEVLEEKISGARRVEPQKPSAGRIVMFCDTFKVGAIYPAIIAEVPRVGMYSHSTEMIDPQLIHLAVIDIYQNPCIRPQQFVRYSEGKESGTWHWPERL